MTIEALNEQVIRRVHAFEAGDPALALAPEALAEASALLAASGERGERSMVGLYAVAWLHWLRFLALPHDQRADDLRTARRLFEPFHEYEPGKVPDALRREAGFEDDGATARLDAAMKALRQAVLQEDQAALGPSIDHAVELLHSVPAARNGTCGLWTVLALAYQQRYTQDKGGDHWLFLMVDAARKGAMRPNRGDYGASLDILVVVLNFRYTRTGSVDDVDEVIQTLRNRLSLFSPDDKGKDRTIQLFHLAKAFSDRFDRPEAPPRVEESDAVQLRDVVQRTPPGHEVRPLLLAAVGRVLRALYEQTGSAPYLDESIDALRAAALAEHPANSRQRRYLAEVATSLRLRHTDVGNPTDLTEAIDALRAAARGMSPTERVYNAGRNPPTAPELWYRIADALGVRAAHHGDLDEAIAAVSAALNATPPDIPRQAGKPGHDDMQRLYAQLVRSRRR